MSIIVRKDWFNDYDMYMLNNIDGKYYLNKNDYIATLIISEKNLYNLFDKFFKENSWK